MSTTWPANRITILKRTSLYSKFMHKFWVWTWDHATKGLGLVRSWFPTRSYWVNLFVINHALDVIFHCCIWFYSPVVHHISSSSRARCLALWVGPPTRPRQSQMRRNNSIRTLGMIRISDDLTPKFNTSVSPNRIIKLTLVSISWRLLHSTTLRNEPVWNHRYVLSVLWPF